MSLSFLSPITRALAAMTLVVALGAPGPAAAQSRGNAIDRAVTVEEETQNFTVAADGSFVATGRQIVRIEEERAVQAAAQRYLGYNSSLEKLEVVEAWTEKADGRRVPVQPEQIKDQQEPRSTGAPMFQDTRLKVIVFPDVAVGDRIVFAWRRTRSTPLWQGQFEDRSAPGMNPIARFEITYDMPAAMPLYADALGFEPVAVDSGAGRKVYRWKYASGPVGRIEAGSVAFSDYGQRLVVSTFADWGAFGRAYDTRARPQAQPGEPVKALAARIVQAVPEPREPRAQALALADWVRRNIRYVAVYIGPGGVVPHSADSVLENRYGDCKDHVALLEALLAAAGIDSTPALINLGNAYRLNGVPSLGVLNHVITYVPSLQLWLDSTADSIAPGWLPLPDIDKPVVLTRTGTVFRTPVSQPTGAVTTTRFDIDARGGARIRQEHQVRGWQAEPSRYMLRHMSVDARNDLVQRMLQSLGQNGRGSVTTGDLNSTGDVHTTVVEAQSGNMVNLPGPVGIPAYSSLSSNIALTGSVLARERERTQLFVCVGQDLTEKATLRFPTDMTLIAVPKPVKVSAGALTYEANYAQTDNELTVERRLVLNTPGAVCEPKEFLAMRPAIEAMARDLKAQVIVKGE